MRRRELLFGTIGWMATLAGPTAVGAQALPLALRLVRRTGWEELMGRNQCIISDLYVSTPQFPRSDLGAKIGTGLELAWRNNLSEISAIPQGDYRGFPRTGGALGWRIELEGVSGRTNVQIHLGNTPNNTRGCILVGTSTASDAQCVVSGSGAAMASLKAAYGEGTSRPVVLRIQA